MLHGKVLEISGSPRSHSDNIARRVTKSNAPMPSTERTVQLGSVSVSSWRQWCAMRRGAQGRVHKLSRWGGGHVLAAAQPLRMLRRSQHVAVRMPGKGELAEACLAFLQLRRQS